MFAPCCVHTKKSQKLGTNEFHQFLFEKESFSCYAFFVNFVKFHCLATNSKKSPNIWKFCLDRNEKKMDEKSHCAAVIVQNPFFNVLHKQTRCLNAQVDLHTSSS